MPYESSEAYPTSSSTSWRERLKRYMIYRFLLNIFYTNSIYKSSVDVFRRCLLYEIRAVAARMERPSSISVASLARRWRDVCRVGLPRSA